MTEFKTVQELLAVPDRWTKGVYAQIDKDPNGDDVDTDDPAATCWCLIGAVFRVYPNCEAQIAAIRKLGRALGSRTDPSTLDPEDWTTDRADLEVWNDHPKRTHQEVLDLVTRAGV